MKTPDRLGVYLNSGPGDDEALAFAGLLCKIAQPHSIYCISIEGLETSSEIPAWEPQVIRERLIAALPANIAQQPEIHVSQAVGLHGMLRTARDSDLDMIVVGRRLPNDELGVGSAFYRLSRKAPCDVLAVPFGAHAHLSRLLVLVDGSEHSRLALELALFIARNSGERPQVLVQSVYSVGYGYRYSGKSLEQASRDMEAVTREKIEAFLADVDTSGVEFSVAYSCSQDPDAVALDLATSKSMDAVVIGSRGTTLPAIALLSTTAERVLVRAAIPVLVAKRKGETFRFLDAVLENLQGS